MNPPDPNAPNPTTKPQGRRKRRPRRGRMDLAQAYEQFVKPTPIGERLEESVIFRVWDEAVGQTIARHFQPCGFHGGVLTLLFENNAWAQEAQWRKRAIIEAVNARLDRPRVVELQFRYGKISPAPPDTGG